MGLKQSALLSLLLPFALSVSAVIARSDSDEAIHSFFADGLLRFARNDGGASGLLQFIMRGIVGVTLLLPAIERRAVVGCQREAALQALRQIRIGDEDAPERDRVGMASGGRRIRGPPAKPATGDQ